MSRAVAILTLAASFLAVGHLAAAEDAVVVSPSGGATQVMLEPLAAPAGAFGAPLAADGAALPGWFMGNIKADIGFNYLRPLWGSHATRLALPPATVAAFSAVGDGGNLSEEFAFVPKFGLEYDFPDLGLGVAASGQMISLSGNLTRSLTQNGGTGSVSARGQVDLAVANLIEAVIPLDWNAFPCLHETALADLDVVFTIGTRYVHTQQHYHADLSGGTNTGSVDADQEFDGFGLTGSIDTLLPLRHNWFLYNTSRGSIVVGRNNRNSSFSAVFPANASASLSSAFKDDKTDFVPAGEFELGVGWQGVVGSNTLLGAAHTGRLVWLKAGAVFQMWGDLGLLPQAGATAPGTNSSLYLIGFTVMAGVKF
jgi:hypothetical protein